VEITFITVGGTIDKVYYDAKSRYEVGDSIIDQVLRQGEVGFDYRVVALMRKDSLEMTDADRALIRATIEAHDHRRFVITHGTDTMVETALSLGGLDDRIIALTGALNPARFQISDAAFNIGMAVATVQSMAAGVYVTMNGRVFDPRNVRKNRERNCFESLDDSASSTGSPGETE